METVNATGGADGLVTGNATGGDVGLVTGKVGAAVEDEGWAGGLTPFVGAIEVLVTGGAVGPMLWLSAVI